MKQKLIKIVLGENNFNGNCRICYQTLKKNEKFFLFEFYDSKGHIFEYRICFNCLIELLLNEFGYNQLRETIDKMIVGSI